jgi:ATP-dependent helicase/DNAse subunit B
LKLLLTGPPATGKSTAVMERFRAGENAYLITPTATIAEHLRHELARSGFPVRPSRVGTLSQFLDQRGAQWQLPAPAPRALLHMLVSEALDQLRPIRFAALRGSHSLHEALADLIEEAPHSEHPLAELFSHVRKSLANRGYALHDTRLRAAAAKIRDRETSIPAQVVIDGFFTFAPAELEFVEALASRSAVTIALPEYPRSDEVRRRLEGAGFQVWRLVEPRRAPSRTLFSATTPEREAEEIARRILDYTGRGRRFRDIGIVLRSREPYGPLIQTTLARFGIPARAYFSGTLSSHPAIAFLSGSVNALLGGWDRAALASLLRMPVSGLGATPAGDRVDFELREQLPGTGMIAACPIALSELPDRWRTERHTPLVWAGYLLTLRKLLPAPEIPYVPADRDQIHVWRSTASALKLFEETLRQTASLLPPSDTMPLEQFWPYVETALMLEQLRIENRRRDMVHIMDVFEARQWELPVVFVCGLLERIFPQYHREDPLLGDAVRARLGMSTSAQRQQEERFLFELALTRATEETILSYARFNEKGEETIPSFFLEGGTATACEQPVRPAPARSVPVVASPEIRDPGLLKKLARIHSKLSPTGVESFLQCPFQFFARRTLDLRQRPPAPRDRLTIMVQGQILHRVLAEWARAPLLGTQVFSAVFEEECARLRIPATYRTEAVRLELLRNFEAFLSVPGVNLDGASSVEQDFRFELSPGLTIRGRIDRLETDRNNRALVIDYKYSPGNKVRERVDESEGGNLVQAGLYMLAAERALGLVPVGMLYCGLKKEVSWGGWHLPIPGLERAGESRTPEALRELMDSAAQSAIQVHESISSGRIAVQPRDSKKCARCDYRDACRVETETSGADDRFVSSAFLMQE